MMKKLPLLLISFVSSLSFGQVDLLNTDFQTGMPVAYTLVDNDGNTPAAQVSEYTSAWITVQDPENTTDTVAASTSYFSPVGTADRWMITPALTLGSFGNFIEWEAKSQDASYPDDYMVLVSTTDDQITSFTDTIGSIDQENFEWTYRTVDLSSEGYNNQTIYVAFVNVTEDGFKLYVDDIRVWKEDPVGIEELTETIQVNLYPNPTTGFITIQTAESIKEIKVISTNGRTILTTASTQIDLSSYPSGVYFVNIETENGVVTKRVVKN